MHRLFAILALAAAAAAPLAACKKRAEKEKSAPGPAPADTSLGFDELQTMFPEKLAGMPRQMVVPTPEIPQASAYYQADGNSRSGHVVYTLLSDPARTLKDWEGRFSGRASIAGRTAYTRTYKLKTSPETAHGCLLVGDRVGACVDIAPGVPADLPALFGELPIAELEKRSRR